MDDLSNVQCPLLNWQVVYIWHQATECGVFIYLLQQKANEKTPQSISKALSPDKMQNLTYLMLTYIPNIYFCDSGSRRGRSCRFMWWLFGIILR